jgi:N,N'-diacetyllegionaminate synthase
MKIGKKKIGKNHPAFLIAEAGVNHNGSLKIGKKLIDVAVKSGADAVKFQTFKAENIIIPDGPKAKYHLETTGSDKSQSWYQLLKTQEISKKMHIELIKYCKKKKIIFLSTPYDNESADLLEELGIQAFKIASTDNDNYPFLKYLSKKNKPIIISTAMSNMKDVLQAEKTLIQNQCKQYAFLQCTGNYPSKIEDSNLKVIKTFKQKLNCPIGYSDHTMTDISGIAAIAMGAKIIEKHFTIDKKLYGPDHRMSANPKELFNYFFNIRQTEKSLGISDKFVLSSEKQNKKKLKKSIVSIKDINKNDKITLQNVSFKRPGTGMRPIEFNKIFNKRINKSLKKNTLLKKSMFSV